ncbi:uncharacterized protein TA08140 [Theileria annulata]|uniref:Uncharacterized protein n=1 Tax=Theileria annulata TaxID=5874 RepID=Q4U9T1_THEAN|nr:uncharacterized protein TA08140 [Theileria annulata]CAI76422.1 hypothetical protein TA08140 [Theileria annulata]|eukprot:XP_953047.1 hypothetical protein TA08140 [Theileria annulata]
MQLIKRVGAFLIHSAYISSNNLIYTKIRTNHFRSLEPANETVVSDIVDNIVESSVNPIKTLRIIDTTLNSVDNPLDIIDKKLDNTDEPTSNIVEKVDTVDSSVNQLIPVYSTEKAVNTDDHTKVGLGTKTDYVDPFNQTYLKKIKSGPNNQNSLQDVRLMEGNQEKKGVVLGYEEYNNLKEEIAMLKRELTDAKNYMLQRKKGKRVYEPIEVRLNIRIHESDLLTKCNFFKKKALKGYPLILTIKTDGNAKDYTLAAEGILNKAKIFLGNSCTPAGKITVSGSRISQRFSPVDDPFANSDETHFPMDTPETKPYFHSYSEYENNRTASYQRNIRPETPSKPMKDVVAKEIKTSSLSTGGKSGEFRYSAKLVNNPRVPEVSVSSAEPGSRWIVKHKSSTSGPPNNTNSNVEPKSEPDNSKWKVLNKTK